MKTQLTRKQSTYLIDLGVPKEKASKVAWAQIRDSRGDKIPKDAQNRGVMDKSFAMMSVGFISYSTDDIFSLDDFLNGEILPKEFTFDDTLYELHIDWMQGEWWVSYQYDGQKGVSVVECNNKELIASLYKLTCWYYGDYLKREKK